jgi:hypothetical protein
MRLAEEMDSSTAWLILVGVGVLAVPLGWCVHLGLDRCCVLHARRWCNRRGIEIVRCGWGPAFDRSGMKTEFTWVDIDCIETDGRRMERRLRVWLFGVREVVAVPVADDPSRETNR